MVSDKRTTPVYPPGGTVPPPSTTPSSPPSAPAQPVSLKDSLQRKLQGVDLPAELKAQLKTTPPLPSSPPPPTLPGQVPLAPTANLPPKSAVPPQAVPAAIRPTNPPPPPSIQSVSGPSPTPVTPSAGGVSSPPPSHSPPSPPGQPSTSPLPPPPFAADRSRPPSPPAGGSDDLVPARRGGLFKKLKVILLVLALLALLVIGALAIKNFMAKNAKSATDNAKPDSSQSITLTYWSLWEPAEVFQPILTEYSRQNPGVTVNFVKQSHQDYRTRLMTAISKGEGPDIFRFHNTWVPMLEKELAPLDKTAYTADEFANTFYPIIQSDLTNSAGQLVGVPLMIDGLSMYINQEVFDNAGLTVPTTWVELENVAKQLTLYDDRQRIERSGVALGTTSNVDHWSDIVATMMLQNSVNLTDVAGSVDPVGNSLAGDALRYYISFAQTHRFWDDTLPQSTLAFATGKTVVYFGPSWRAEEIRQINPALKFTMHPVPQLPGGQTGWATYWAEGVSSQSPHQKEAMKLLKFLSSKQNLEAMFETASRTRIFGLPYPRLDQADLLKSHPYLRSIGNQAPYYQSWYLASNTYDNGINEEMTQYFADAINSISAGGDVDQALQTVTQGVSQVLVKYGIPSN